MNAIALHACDTSHTPATAASDAARPHAGARGAKAPARYRARELGVGYGRSSGYAADKRYTSDWGLARFRFR